MDLAFNVATGSSTQIALFVAPVLVMVGHSIGQPLGLEFTLLEIMALVLRRHRLVPGAGRQYQLVRRFPAPGDLYDPGNGLPLRMSTLPCLKPARWVDTAVSAAPTPVTCSNSIGPSNKTNNIHSCQ
jgi:hypothetical protein